MTVESWVAIIGALTALVTALGTLGAVIVKLGQIEIKIDGRLTQLLELTEKSSHAEGVADQKKARAK